MLFYKEAQRPKQGKNTMIKDLSGKFLIASPYSLSSDVFNKSLIYVVSHSDTGAMGLAVNNLVNKLPANSIMDLFKDQPAMDASQLVLPIYQGGPVEQERGFILHTLEYNKTPLMKVNPVNNLGISSNIEILRDIVQGSGPKRSIFMLGYSGWSEGQLESEIQKGMWIVADSSQDLIFAPEEEDKWSAALEEVGIDSSTFSPRIGNC